MVEAPLEVVLARVDGLGGGECGFWPCRSFWKVALTSGS